MKQRLDPFRKILEILFWPLVWPHEYCHYWTARRLGLLARIKGARTYVNRVTLPQHILIALAPTVPSLILFGIALFAYQRLAAGPAAGGILTALVALAGIMLLSCALDWWVIVRGLLHPASLVVDSEAILFLSAATPQARRALRSRLENRGYFTDWVSSGQAAVQSIRRNPFNLIVVDTTLQNYDLHALRLALSLHQDPNGAKILPIYEPGELARIPHYLEIGLPPDRFLTSTGETHRVK